jgi:aspartate aminotransferase-like enzyme
MEYAVYKGKKMPKQILMTPGPTPVAESTLMRMALPVPHHRHPGFKKILHEIREGLKYLFQTEQEVIILASSGTGAMEGAVVNALQKSDRVLVIQAGKFGERWSEICKAHGLAYDELALPWGQAVSPAAVQARLDQKPYRAVLMQATETSTGAVHPVREIAAITRRRDTLLFVDGITGVGVFPLPFDEWGLDVLLTGSQKALMLPPGLAFVCLSKRAWEASKQSDLPKFYFDFAKEKKNLEKDQTAYTPAITLLIGLQEVLARIKSQGLPALFAETHGLAEATRAAVKALGLELYAAEAPSDAVTAVKVPAGLDGEAIVKTMRDTYGVTIAGGQDQVKGKIFRIAHMGCITAFDVIAALSALEMTLAGMGYGFSIGAGTGKATALLGPVLAGKAK